MAATESLATRSVVPARKRRAPSGTMVWLGYLVGLLYAGYFVLRYGGLWTENDTAVFSSVTTQTLQAGNVLSSPYSHGFGYPAWLGSLSLLTGIPPPAFNQVVMPYVGMLLVLAAAFLAYRTLLGSDRAVLLAVGILFAIPDLMFSVLRGNHEKLNIACTLAALYVLFKGFEAMGRGNPARLAVWVMLFYTLVFTDATVNDYFASTFVLAATLSVPLVYVLLRWRVGMHGRRPAILRSIITVAVSWLLVWWFMFFVFPSAGQDFALLPSTSAKVQALATTLQPATNPYAISGQQWAGTTTSWALSAFRWLLLAGSFLTWSILLWRVLRRGRPLSLSRLFLLALYGAFGLLVAVAVPLDFSGLDSGSNLELRNFAYFALLAAPILAWGIRDLSARYRPGTRRPPQRPDSARRVLSTGGILLALVIVLGLLKTTIDPLVSNQWIFYSPAESQALTFFWFHGRYDSLWVGPDRRLSHVLQNWQAQDPYGNQTDDGIPGPQARDLLRSPQVIANSIAQALTPPLYGGENRVYDEGEVQIYRLTPRTPFQN